MGSAIVRRLLNDGHAVRVLDDHSRGRARRLADLGGDLEIRIADIRDSDAVIDAGKGMDGLIHLAAVNGTRYFYERPELVLDVGVRGILSVMDCCRTNGIGDLLVASSSEVYQTPAMVPTDETAPLIVPDVLNPRYSYGGSKIVSELIAINYGRRGFDCVRIVRPHNVYGPDMGREHVIPEFSLRAWRAVTDRPAGPVEFPIQGDGNETRAFIHIDDFVDGFIRVLADGEHLGVYHIGTEDEIKISALARKVVAYFGRDARIVEGAKPSGATPRRCPDISRLRRLGFEPRVTLDDGLYGVIEWYVRNEEAAS